MALFVMLTTLTDEGRKTVKKNPRRILEVDEELEAVGVKVVGQYFVLGPYDFVNILEAPDAQAMAYVAMELGARGTVQTVTMSAMALEDFIGAMQK
jgi:uncharacterized protein with GYD domain